MSDKKTTIEELKGMVKKFNKERDWDQFHTPKDMAMAIAAEAAEVVEIFLYKTNSETEDFFKDRRKRVEIEDELSDVFWAVLMMCEKYDIDLSDALKEKMRKSSIKYPIEKARGSNKKYTEL